MARNSIPKEADFPEPLDGPSLMFEELDGLLGYRLRRAQGAMHRDFMAAVASLDHTQKQAATLWLINSNAGVAQVSVAGALGMDRATMMAIIDRLEGGREAFAARGYELTTLFTVSDFGIDPQLTADSR